MMLFECVQVQHSWLCFSPSFATQLFDDSVDGQVVQKFGSG
jgi:hypothetical protein